MANQNATTGPGNIQKFTFTGNTGNKVDASAAVVEYRYYENILSNTITSTATIIETGIPRGILDGVPIRGGELVDIIVTDPRGNKIDLTTTLHVDSVRDINPGAVQDLYNIDFVSKEQILNDNTRVVEEYDGKISENVQKILEGVLKTDVPLDIDKTSLEYNFYGNNKKPFFVCTLLASQSVPEPKDSESQVGFEGGFLFYQTSDGMKFKSINSLLNQEVKKKYIYNDTGNLPVGYTDNIITYDIIKNTSLSRNSAVGAYNNETIYFDFFNMDYNVVQFSIEDQEDKVKNAGEDYVFVSKDSIQKPSRIFQTILDLGVNPTGSGNKQLDNFKKDPTKANFDYKQTMVQTIMRYNQLYSVQVEVKIPADFTIQAGDLIECTFPRLEATNNKQSNKQSGGKYIVASVCHRVTPRETFTALGLIRDSFGKKGGS